MRIASLGLFNYQKSLKKQNSAKSNIQNPINPQVKTLNNNKINFKSIYDVEQYIPENSPLKTNVDSLREKLDGKSFDEISDSLKEKSWNNDTLLSDAISDSDLESVKYILSTAKKTDPDLFKEILFEETTFADFNALQLALFNHNQGVINAVIDSLEDDPSTLFRLAAKEVEFYEDMPGVNNAFYNCKNAQTLKRMVDIFKNYKTDDLFLRKTNNKNGRNILQEFSTRINALELIQNLFEGMNKDSIDKMISYENSNGQNVLQLIASQKNPYIFQEDKDEFSERNTKTAEFLINSISNEEVLKNVMLKESGSETGVFESVIENKNKELLRLFAKTAREHGIVNQSNLEHIFKYCLDNYQDESLEIIIDELSKDDEQKLIAAKSLACVDILAAEDFFDSETIKNALFSDESFEN